MSELLDKQVNAQKEKIFRVHVSSCKPMKKCAMKMKIELEKKCARKNVIHGRKPFITSKQKTAENDLHELLGNDCGYIYNEGSICVVNE